MDSNLSEILPSLIRTYVPSLVGAFIAWLLTLGVDVGDEGKTALITFGTALLTALYYTAVRLLERRAPALGVLLGSKRQPVSTSPTDLTQVRAAKNAIEADRKAA